MISHHDHSPAPQTPDSGCQMDTSYTKASVNVPKTELSHPLTTPASLPPVFSTSTMTSSQAPPHLLLLPFPLLFPLPPPTGQQVPICPLKLLESSSLPLQLPPFKALMTFTQVTVTASQTIFLPLSLNSAINCHWFQNHRSGHITSP